MSSTESDPIVSHVINLPRDKERRSLVAARAGDAGLLPRFFRARTASDLEPGVYVEPSLSPGQIGCLLSHLALLREIATEPPTARHLVLEDDVVFFDGFRESLGHVLRELGPSGADLVQLGWIPAIEESSPRHLLVQRVKTGVPLRRLARRLGRPVPAEPPILQSATPGWGTHCYLVTPSSAERFARFLEGPILAPVDHYLRALSLIGPPGRVMRTRFPIAGQDRALPSTVQAGVSGRTFIQIDQRGRPIRST